MSFGAHMYEIILNTDIRVELWGIKYIFFLVLAYIAKLNNIPKLLCQFTLPPTVHETSGCATSFPIVGIYGVFLLLLLFQTAILLKCKWLHCNLIIFYWWLTLLNTLSATTFPDLCKNPTQVFFFFYLFSKYNVKNVEATFVFLPLFSTRWECRNYV